MKQSSVAPVALVRFEADGQRNYNDLVVVEEPLEIRLGYGPEHQRREMALAVTMRTPGHDAELALGFLLSEGIVKQATEVLSLKHCQNMTRPEQAGNVIRAELSPDVVFEPNAHLRHFYTSSSCGVCGKSSIEAVMDSVCHFLPAAEAPQFAAAVLHSLPNRLRAAQQVFGYTGGLHAAGLFDREGKLLLLREDAGRHNALDKLIGATAALNMLPLSDYCIQLSGRISFELVQKSLTAGVPLLAAIGAPSSLACQLANSAGLSLVGFMREQRFNVYTCPSRISWP
jgi:FdhD protein